MSCHGQHKLMLQQEERNRQMWCNQYSIKIPAILVLHCMILHRVLKIFSIDLSLSHDLERIFAQVARLCWIVIVYLQNKISFCEYSKFRIRGRSFVNAFIQVAIQEWSNRIITAAVFLFGWCYCFALVAVVTILFLSVASIFRTAIIAYQNQHSAVVASCLLVLAWRIAVVVIVVRFFAHQTPTDRLPKMGRIRSAWIKYLQARTE